MKYKDLCDFICQLEVKGELVCIIQFIDIDFEMIEIVDRMLCVGGFVLLFENFKNYDMFVLVNLFGILECVVMGMG